MRAKGGLFVSVSVAANKTCFLKSQQMTKVAVEMC